MVSHAISLDKGKSILTKDRAQDWGADDFDAFEKIWKTEQLIKEGMRATLLTK